MLTLTEPISEDILSTTHVSPGQHWVLAKTGKESIVQVGDKTVPKGIHKVEPLNGRLSYMKLTINVKTKCTESTGRGRVGLRGSKDCCHFDRMRG